jgi:hypothetical protein
MIIVDEDYKVILVQCRVEALLISTMFGSSSYAFKAHKNASFNPSINETQVLIFCASNIWSFIWNTIRIEIRLIDI